MDEECEKIATEIEEHYSMVECAGFLNWEHYQRTLSLTVSGLRKFGNLFERSLGFALEKAEVKDALKITRYWHQECEKYALLQKMTIAKLQGENNG
jgi:hypothetical protein